MPDYMCLCLAIQQTKSRGKMEATIAAPKVKAPHKSSGNETTAAPQRAAELMVNGKDRAPEQTPETKVKTTGTSGVLRMETTKASTSDPIARAAEKVASSQIAIVLQSARAEGGLNG
ncbi:hypothetical protein JD844_012842 [Phrynosoma platyrhinos]|uniref:Uncharacterized protein n=1 Tax=Phrynosoma platyrhinos TaxID=52577 RepID=A0ABQ7TLA0_PHRPL|nr:hypothetical protein JD844_012842 [Phrynosoma platyrhinos]